jgi:hypothetical protein
MSNAFVVAFRDRGVDEYRKKNFDFVTEYVRKLDLGPVYIVDDGRTGSESFCRHAAYNAGSRRAFDAGATTITYYEADMIVPRQQLVDGIAAALETPRLVIPFDARHEYDADQSDQIINGADPNTFTAPVIKRAPRRIGAVNIISAETYRAIGCWDEQYAGSHWDDRSMGIAFRVCTGNDERWIPGPSHHLHHLPGYQGGHLTFEDRAATARNRRRFMKYERARTPEQIRRLTTGN